MPPISPSDEGESYRHVHGAEIHSIASNGGLGLGQLGPVVPSLLQRLERGPRSALFPVHGRDIVVTPGQGILDFRGLGPNSTLSRISVQSLWNS